MRLPPLTLVIGGASSGKSAFAEEMLRRTGLPKVYIATAEALDEEMAAKIAAHRSGREGQGWRTVEAPLDIEDPLLNLGPGEAVLIDCISFWLTNQLLDDADVGGEVDVLCRLLDGLPGPIVIVTNDVSGGVVPDNRLARRFRTAQGRLNQRLAARADLVVTVIAGLPMVLKGVLPSPDDLGDDAGGAAW